MAFTEAQRIKISTILGTTPDLVYYHLTSGAFELTTAKQEAVEEQIDLWDAGVGSDFVTIEANVANYGAAIDPEKSKNAIRKAIAGIMERLDWVTSSTGSFEMVRG